MTSTASIVAFGFTLALLPLLLFLLRRRNLLDVPNARSSHTLPTPRGAGLAIAIGAVTASMFASSLVGSERAGLLVAAAAFGLIGLADDFRSMSPLMRLGLQFVAAVAALPWLLAGLSGSGAWKSLFVIGCILWLISFVNAFNFMDGINGISGGVALVAGMSLLVLSRLRPVSGLGAAGAMIAAASLAFLPFNFPHARLFLGDVGSYFVGAWLAAAVVLGLRAGVTPEAVIAPLVLYLADTSTTILRRVMRREPWTSAHRDHAYQRLVLLGWSHTRTTIVVVSATAACAGLGLLSLPGSIPMRVAADAAIAAIVVAYLVAPDWLGSRDASSDSAATM